MIALLLVSAWALALATAGPKAFGAIPSQFLLTVAAGYVAWRTENRRGLGVVLAIALAWGLVIMPCAVLNSEDAVGVLQILRAQVVIPFIALTLGFCLARSDRRLLFAALAVSAVANVAAMFITAATSATTAIMEYGTPVRIYGNILTDEMITATGAAANCIAGFMLSGWAISRLPAAYRGGAAILFTGAVGLGLFTGTRAPVLATGMVFALHFCAELIRNKNAFRIVAALVTAGIIAFIVLMLVPSDRFVFLDRFSTEAILDRTFSGRSDIWADRWRMIQARPIGYGQLETFGFDTFSSHNLFLELAFLTGIVPGLLATVALFSAGVLAFLRITTHRSDSYARCLSAGVLIVLLFSMFESTISSCYQAFTWTMVILGAFFGYERDTENIDIRNVHRDVPDEHSDDDRALSPA